jgi:hypothetical protein
VNPAGNFPLMRDLNYMLLLKGGLRAKTFAHLDSQFLLDLCLACRISPVAVETSKLWSAICCSFFHSLLRCITDLAVMRVVLSLLL